MLSTVDKVNSSTAVRVLKDVRKASLIIEGKDN